jgi:hypothetical protein
MWTDKKLYLFPSLAKVESIIFFLSSLQLCANYNGVVQTELITFKGSNDLEIKFQGGVRFNAPEGIVFVPGFFCQLIVKYLKKLNVSSF